MRTQAQELLKRGFSTPMIGRQLGVGPKVAARLVKTPTESWEPAEKHAQVWRGARCRAARLLIELGLTRTRAAEYIGVGRRALYNMLREVKPNGEPLIRIGLRKRIVGRQNEVIDKGEYRILDFSPDVALVRTDRKDGRMVHFCDPTAIRGNFYLISDNLFEEYPCKED